jgi:hypothetical protein
LKGDEALKRLLVFALMVMVLLPVGAASAVEVEVELQPITTQHKKRHAIFA